MPIRIPKAVTSSTFLQEHLYADVSIFYDRKAFGTAGLVYLVPIDVPYDVWIDGIIYGVGATALGNVRACVYKELSNLGIPDNGSLVVESDAVPQEADYAIQFIPIPLTFLAAGKYYLGLQGSDVSGTFDYGLVEFAYGSGIRNYTRVGGFGAFTNPCPLTVSVGSYPIMKLHIVAKALPGVLFDQDVYRWFIDDVAEAPTPLVAENTLKDGIDNGDVFRLRLGLSETLGSSLLYNGRLKLQYATSLSGGWADVPASTYTTKPFRYFNGKGVDQALIANLLLSNATVKQYFVESYPSAYGLGFRKPDRGEFDICLQAFNVASLQDYYFRAVVNEGFIKYFSQYPRLRSVDTALHNLEFSLREHKYSAAGSPAITFDKPSSVILRAISTNPSLGATDIFIVCQDRSWLNGKYIRWGWEGYMSVATAQIFCQILDGEYVRSSDVDFPTNADIPLKGAGVLQTPAIKSGTFGYEIQDVLVNVAGGTQAKCTIRFAIYDAWVDRNYWLQMHFFQVNSSAAGIGFLKGTSFRDAIVMERTGTLGDYGYVGSGLLAP